MITTLLTKEEALTLIEDNVSSQAFSKRRIFQAETSAFEKYLGNDFYTVLKADLADYSGSSVWTAGTYLTGTIKIHNGIYKIALVDTDKEPSVTTDWGNAPKFNTECYENLWCMFLGFYLAICCDYMFIARSRFHRGKEGVVKKKSEDYTPASQEEIDFLKAAVFEELLMVFNNMNTYMNNNNTGCFDTYKNLKTSTSCGEIIQEKFEGQEDYGFG